MKNDKAEDDHKHVQQHNHYDDDEPPLWVTIAKLVVGAIILIGGTGLALWYVNQKQELGATRDPATSAPPDWGIHKDSPIRRLR